MTIKRDGKQYESTGKLDADGIVMRVWLYNEHRRAIERAGYDVPWDKPEIRLGEPVKVLLIILLLCEPCSRRTWSLEQLIMLFIIL